MTHRLKSQLLAALFLLLVVVAIFAQIPPPTGLTPPKLSTSDIIALNNLEAQKRELTRQELTIIQEWDATHPGWKVNPSTFVVEKERADVKGETKK